MEWSFITFVTILVLHFSSCGEYRLITPVGKNIVVKFKNTNQLLCTLYSRQHETFLL